MERVRHSVATGSHKYTVVAGEAQYLKGGLLGAPADTTVNVDPDADHGEQPIDRRRQGPEAVDKLGADRAERLHRPDTPQPPVQLELLRLVGDVLVGEVRVHRQVDGRRQSFHLGLAALAAGLALLDRLGE